MKKLTFLVLVFFFATPSISLRAGSEPLIVMVSLSNHAHAATVSGGTIDLPETGQTTCYDAAGTAIACAGTGQDGELGAGVSWPSPRFTDNSNGTVTDNLTGLVWLKNANCAGAGRNWTTALTDVALDVSKCTIESLTPFEDRRAVGRCY